jgi:hypothetical protein
MLEPIQLQFKTRSLNTQFHGTIPFESTALESHARNSLSCRKIASCKTQMIEKVPQDQSILSDSRFLKRARKKVIHLYSITPGVDDKNLTFWDLHFHFKRDPILKQENRA